MTEPCNDDILDDLFHGCAWEAYLHVAHTTHRWPPDSESVRRLTYALYESSLRERHQNPLDSPRKPCHGATMPND